MAVQLVLSLITQDQPGVVQRVAEVIAAHDGNWIDSQMARLGGAFAGIVRLEVAPQSVAALERALVGLSGMTVIVQHTAQEAAPVGQAATIELTGADHPGIVRDISGVLAARGVSIDALETEIFAGSMSGQAMFKAVAKVIIPPSVDLTALQDTLQDLALDIMAEIKLKQAA